MDARALLEMQQIDDLQKVVSTFHDAPAKSSVDSFV